jgi:hypothetical protein
VAGPKDKALNKAGVPYEKKELPDGGHRFFYKLGSIWIDLPMGVATGN